VRRTGFNFYTLTPTIRMCPCEEGLPTRGRVLFRRKKSARKSHLSRKKNPTNIERYLSFEVFRRVGIFLDYQPRHLANSFFYLFNTQQLSNGLICVEKIDASIRASFLDEVPEFIFVGLTSNMIDHLDIV